MLRQVNSIAPGARVVIRDAGWLVRKVERTSTGGHALSVIGISELVKDKEAFFLDELDKNIEVFNPVDTSLVVDSSSPKGSFNALIYMHRYRPDTVSVLLNEYLREFRAKLNARKNHLEQVSISGAAFQTEKTKALKEIESLKKMIAELEDYEREVIYPPGRKTVGNRS